MKVGTTLESNLYDRILQKAKEDGLRVNEVFEQALRAYLSDDEPGSDYVAESYGSYQVSQEAFDEIVESDIYEA